ncbi:MAG: hypothetical protein KOO65_05370 [Desulfobacterales bacterium]|nr:hypothetical protein [Desulfobacterales bacterium]
MTGLITQKDKLLNLCSYWEKQAKKRFQAAEGETSEIGRRALEHGAIIHYNHAQELRAAMHPKFSFDFIFKIFRKYTKRPRAGRF